MNDTRSVKIFIVVVSSLVLSVSGIRVPPMKDHPLFIIYVYTCIYTYVYTRTNLKEIIPL